MVTAISQPSNFYDVINSALGSAKDLHESVDKAEKSFSKETGIDIESDVVPGLKGDGIVAAYPSEADGGGIDVLTVFDDKNGANPTELADKLQASIDKEAKDDTAKNGAWLTKVDRPDAQEFHLSDRVTGEMRKGLHNGPDDTFRDDVLVAKKTVAWAHVNGAVMLASSQDLLDKAISAYEGKETSLGTDKTIASAADPSDGSQAMFVMSLPRIAQGVRGSLRMDKMDKDGRKVTDQILSFMDGLTTPISLKSKMSPDGSSSGKFFIPMDYVKLIDLIGNISDQKKNANGA